MVHWPVVDHRPFGISVCDAIGYCYRHLSSARITTQFAQYVLRTNGEILPWDGLAHSTSFDLGWRSSRFRDFPVFRPCVTPALATSTLTRVARFQTTYTRRIASLMPAFPTATVKATVDPRTSSQRIPSCNHIPTGPVQHRLQSLSKCARSNAGRFRSVYPA